MNGWADRGARVGVFLLGLLVFLALAAPFVSPYAPRAQDRLGFHSPPSLPSKDCDLIWFWEEGARRDRLVEFDGCQAHLLGTDGLGRDVLSRSLYGARVSMLTAALGASVAVVVGTLVGAAAGLLGGFWDRLLMRLTELVMALPALYLVLAVRHVFPDDLPPRHMAIVLIGSLVVVGWTSVARVIRSQVLSLREREFILAAVAAGSTRRRLLARHILPNLTPQALLQVGILLPYFFLGEATLSFLGLGVQEPSPSWGNMLASAASNYTAMTTYWWTFAAPAGALTVSVLGANLWVEGLRKGYSTGGSGWGSKQRRQRAS